MLEYGLIISCDYYFYMQMILNVVKGIVHYHSMPHSHLHVRLHGSAVITAVMMVLWCVSALIWGEIVWD